METRIVRPKRRAIPVRVRIAVMGRQGKFCAARDCKELIAEWDHEPALALRDVLPDGSDYVPAQLDPAYIDGLCIDHHRGKTHGTGATTAGTDIGKIKKQRKRERPPKPKRPIPSRGFQKGHRPMQSRPFPKKRPVAR